MPRFNHAFWVVRVAVLAIAYSSAAAADAPDAPGAAPTRRSPQLQPQVTPLSTKYDGVYGRFDGDLALQGGLGLEYQRGPEQSWRGLLRLSANYYQTVGLALEAVPSLTADASHQLRLGVEFSPLFLLRWALGREQGPATLDLVLDSITLAVGVSGGAANENDGAQTDGYLGGFVGGGFGLPLQNKADGLWLWTRSYAYPLGPDDAGPGFTTLLAIGYQAFTVSPWLRTP